MTMHDFSWQAVSSPGESDQFFASDAPKFVPERAFSLSNAWWMIQLCWVYYIADKRKRQCILAEQGWKELACWDNNVDVCGLVERSGVHVLVFRGTQGWRPWLTNLLYRQSQPKGDFAGSVHSGFQLGLMGIWSDIASVLKDISGPLFYVGHSRGGAMAQLAAGFHPPTAIYGFGAPFVGNSLFSERWTHDYYNIVNYRDYVARVLLPEGWGYEPVGDTYWLMPTTLLNNPSREAWIKGISKRDRGLRWVPQLLCLPNPPGPISDHAPANYAANLECAMADQPLAFYRAS